MGLSERKSKQKIGEDPRNTKWAKNQSNPGFKILSSMGWTPSTTSLGASSNSSEPVRTSWKRLPGSSLPIIKSTTSGIGCNPSQACSNSYLLDAPRFVRSSQSMLSVDTAVDSTSRSIENESDRSTKVSIVSNGGGFDDLLSRLNQSSNPTNKLKSIEDNDPDNDSFVVVSLDETTKLINDDHQEQKLRSSFVNRSNRKSDANRIRKRVRILEFCHDPSQESCVGGPPKSKKSKKNHPCDTVDTLLPDDTTSIKNQCVKDKQSGSKVKKSSSIISNFVHLRKPDENEKPTTTASSSSGAVPTTVPLKISRPINPRVASRAKYINAKKLASSENSAAMAEILGIPPPTVLA